MKCAYAVSLTALVALTLASQAGAKAPSEKLLTTLGPQGRAPRSALVADKIGALYGVGGGNVFQLKPPTGAGKHWTYSVLHAFIRGSGDGYSPYGGLIIDPSGILYGTTTRGGVSDAGTVFTLTPPAAGSTSWTETIIYSFPPDLAAPGATLLRDASGVLFGTTINAGQVGAGSVFKLTPPAPGQADWTRTTLYSFQGGADGQNPLAPVVKDSTGALYGTTSQGGTVNLCQNNQGCGTVFKLTPPAAGHTDWTKTTLYIFTGVDANGGPDGGNPAAGLTLDKSGALYGDTQFGGDPDANAGVIFKLSPPVAGQDSWTISVIHTFEITDGAVPMDSLIMDASGVLFGTTYYGGEFGKGTVFQLSPPTDGQTDWTETLLHSFAGNTLDGEAPIGGVFRNAEHDLFGTTYMGGKDNYGTVFEVTP